MRFEQPLLPGTLLRRYQRFLADVELSDGVTITAHCPNTGAMLGCQAPGSRVWLSQSDKPSRKYRHTWEIVETPEGEPVGINTARSNALVDEALAAGRIEPLAGYARRRREVPVDDGRLDFLLWGHRRQPDCYVEVKNVTASVAEGVALFPDARSLRALRHLQSLEELRSKGKRAALVFCVQRQDVEIVSAAADVDPEFAAGLEHARQAGIELYAYRARVSPREICLSRRIAVSAAAL